LLRKRKNSKRSFFATQATAVDRVVDRALQAERTRGLVWHTQGAAKRTMIKAAELLFKAPEANKPTILLMIDATSWRTRCWRNLAAVGLNNVAHAYNIVELNRLLRSDYRGIVVTMNSQVPRHAREE